MPQPPTPRPPAAIEIADLGVDYGDFVAVDDVSLSVPAGEVFGLVGPNGAGKTSTFRVLATLMEPTYGEVRLNGIDILEHPREARQVIGYMPDLAPVPSDLKVWEFLDLFADAHGLGMAAARRARWEEALAEVSLSDKRDVFCRTLSRGQTQRLVLAKTVLHRPRVMILDEPASGMDPLSRRNLRFALRRLADDGTTIIVSSHILGIQSAVALGFIVGVSEFIPVFGPLISAIPALGIAFLESPHKALHVLIAFIAIQQVESNIVTPLVMKRGVHIPPVLTILSGSVMAILFGFLGLLVAVPLVACVMVIVKMLYVHDVVGDDVKVVGEEGAEKDGKS